MARRRLLVVLPMPSSSSMAVLLLLLVAVVLSNVPSSAASMASSLSSSLSASSSFSATTSTSTSTSSSSTSEEDQQEKEKEQEQEQEKAKQQQQEQQKQNAFAAEKAVQQELLKYAKEKGLVSKTNGTGWYKGIAREFVDAHNKLRSRYGVPPIKWDKQLAREARRWSNAMRKDCEMKHSGPKYGESVFRSHDDWNATATEAVTWWAKEEAIYDKEREKCTGGKNFRECGHFALMVDKRSTKVGCARAECFKGGVFIICDYYANDLKDKDKKNKDN